FLIDNQRISTAAWACQASCFANNPAPDLQAGLGEMEIRAENLRFVVCAQNDLLQDAAFPIETWILRKVSDGFRAEISASIIAGDGLGRPLGLLHPTAGIPIMDTSVNTPPGQIDWRDLVQLKWDVPREWHNGGVYVLNQRTWALLATTVDAIGRPLFSPSPIQDQPGFSSTARRSSSPPKCLSASRGIRRSYTAT